MSEKVKTDWESIEREYRAGQLSTREIARQYSVSDTAIRKRAKIAGWTQDLSHQVRERVRSELVRAEVCKSNANPAEIVEAAAARGVEVVRSHRKDISKLQELEQKLLEELGDDPKKLHICQFQGKVIQTTVGIAVTERASALQALAAVQHKRIQLERQAFNLDESEDKEAESIATAIIAARKRFKDE